MKTLRPNKTHEALGDVPTAQVAHLFREQAPSHELCHEYCVLDPVQAACDFFELSLASQPGQIGPRDAELRGIGGSNDLTFGGQITEFVGFGFGHADASTPLYHILGRCR